MNNSRARGPQLRATPLLSLQASREAEQELERKREEMDRQMEELKEREALVARKEAERNVERDGNASENRAAPMTSPQQTYFATLVRDNALIIQDKSKAPNANRLRDNCWKRIHEDYVRRFPDDSGRKLEGLKKRFDALKSEAVKRISALKKKPTGGGPPLPDVSPAVQVLVEMYSDEPSATGLNSNFNSEEAPVAPPLTLANHRSPLTDLPQTSLALLSQTIPLPIGTPMRAPMTQRRPPLPKSSPNTGTADEFNKTQMEVIGIEKEKLKLEVDKLEMEKSNLRDLNDLIRAKTDLIEQKKQYLRMKMDLAQMSIEEAPPGPARVVSGFSAME